MYRKALHIQHHLSSLPRFHWHSGWAIVHYVPFASGWNMVNSDSIWSQWKCGTPKTGPVHAGPSCNSFSGEIHLTKYECLSCWNGILTKIVSATFQANGSGFHLYFLRKFYTHSLVWIWFTFPILKNESQKSVKTSISTQDKRIQSRKSTTTCKGNSVCFTHKEFLSSTHNLSQKTHSIQKVRSG